MASYDYRCDSENCGVVHELIQSIHKPLPESISCPRCGSNSFYIFLVAPGVLTRDMTNKSIDVAIGRDSEARWNRLHDRRITRDKVRQESGKSGLTAVGVNEYVANDKKLVSVRTPEPGE